MTGWLKSLSGAILLLVGIVPTLLGDTFIKQVSHTPAFVMMGQERPEEYDTTVMWFTYGKAVSQGSARVATLYLAAEQTLYLINHVAQVYTVVDFAALTSETAADDSGDQQEMAQSMMGQMEVKVTPTEETAKIDQWETRKYLIDIGVAMMNIKQEIWVTEDAGFDSESYQFLSAGMLAQLPGFADLAEELRQIKGMPVKTVSSVEAMGMMIKTTTSLIEAGEAEAPEGIFEVPVGYTESELVGHGY